MSAENLDYSVPTQARLAAVRSEVAKAVVGQDAAVTGLVVALLAGGHVLLEGVPGVAKTLLVRALAASLELDTKRIQFTPDLMPGDVTGSLIYDSLTCCWLTKLTVLPPKLRQLCLRPWRNARFLLTARLGLCLSLSW